MLQPITRASCAIFLLVIIFTQPPTGAAQQTDANWYKRAAPEECVSYIAWNSEVEKPIEGNATQELMAEPEVRAFVDDLKRRAGLVAPAIMSVEQTMPAEKLELLHALSPKLVASIFERSGCLFVEEVTVARNMETPPKVTAAILIDLGDEADKFVSDMVKMISSENQPTPMVVLAGTKAYQVELQESTGTLYFGNANGILVVAIGKQTYANAIQRMNGASQPDWLTKLEQRSKSLNHVHSLAFLDVKSLMRTVRRAVGPNANVGTELLGISNVDQVQMVSGLDSEGSVTHVLLDATGEVEGLLGLLTKHAIKDFLFEDVPSDSLGAMAFSLDVDGLIDLIRTLETIMGGQGTDYGRFKQEFFENTGIDLEGDLIRNLGNSWMLFNGASDGWVTGTTLIGEVKNAKILTTTVEEFFKNVAAQVKQMPPGQRPKFYKESYAGETIYSMTFPEAWFETSFCIKQDRIYIGMFPQAVKTAIKDLPSEEVLLDDMQVKKLIPSKFLDGQTKLTGWFYVDAKLQAQIIYPYLQVVKEASASLSNEMGADMPALLSGLELPPARMMIRKIKPSMVLVRTSEQGIEIEARQTIPSNSTAAAMPVLVGMLLPAVGQVRQAAKDVQSLNNLKQLSLASLNHESAFMRYPTDGPKGGNDHKFSWRVHILPFIEEGNIYDQIKFDEPWDSDHNKALLAKTPDVFKSPTRNLPEGMTVYRGFKGERGEGVLGGVDGKGTRIGRITDGTSNTILIAEVPDSMATHWAKPDCLNVDEQVAQKLLSAKGSMLVAFCDGSTHRIPTTIATKDLVTFLSCNEGNIAPDLFEMANPRRRRQQNRNREADPRFVLPSKKESF